MTVGADSTAIRFSAAAGSAVHVAMERRERVVQNMVASGYCILN